MREIRQGERVDTKDLFLSHTCSDIHEREHEISVTFENGKSESFDLLVGADGLNSVVRKYIHGAQPAVYSGYSIWRGLAHFSHDFYTAGHISETWGMGKRFGILPSGRGLMYWYATANGPEISKNQERVDEKSQLLQQFGGWHSPIRELLEATEPQRILHNNTYDRPPQRGWSKGRALIIGDAAHPSTPNLGQGGYMALEDALVLAKLLEQEKQVQGVCQQFESLRYRRTAVITNTSRQTGVLGQVESPFWVAARDLLSAALPNVLFERHANNI